MNIIRLIRKTTAIALSASLVVSVNAGASVKALARESGSNELVVDYLEGENLPFLANTTAYCEGKICSHGDRARRGIAASAPQLYGSGLIVYEAVKTENGYELGDLIRYFEIKDCGYGKNTHNGIESKVKPGKDQGTIETLQTIDVYCESMDEAVEWMKQTEGRVYIQIIETARGVK